MSSFAHHRSEPDRPDGLKDSDFADSAFYRDDRNLGLRTKKRLAELDGDVPAQIDEIVERGRAGRLLGEGE